MKISLFKDTDINKIIMIVPISLMNDLEDFSELLLHEQILIKFVTDDEFQILINIDDSASLD